MGGAPVPGWGRGKGHSPQAMGVGGWGCSLLSHHGESQGPLPPPPGGLSPLSTPLWTWEPPPLLSTPPQGPEASPLLALTLPRVLSLPRAPAGLLQGGVAGVPRGWTVLPCAPPAPEAPGDGVNPSQEQEGRDRPLDHQTTRLVLGSESKSPKGSGKNGGTCQIGLPYPLLSSYFPALDPSYQTRPTRPLCCCQAFSGFPAPDTGDTASRSPHPLRPPCFDTFPTALPPVLPRSLSPVTKTQLQVHSNHP